MMRKKLQTPISRLILGIMALVIAGGLIAGSPRTQAQSSDTSLKIAPEVAAWMSGPNLPTASSGETASDFGDDKWKDLHAMFLVNINPFDMEGKRPEDLNPEDFYGLVVEKAMGSSGTRPADSQFQVIHTVDLPDRENDPQWAESESYDPTGAVLFMDNEVDVAPGVIAWYKFNFYNYDGEATPSAYIEINTKTSICSPRWDDSSGKTAKVREILVGTAHAASFDLADCLMFSSPVSKQTIAVTTLLASLFALVGAALVLSAKQQRFNIRHSE